jgi:lysophospholipase L1-like esterase
MTAQVWATRIAVILAASLLGVLPGAAAVARPARSKRDDGEETAVTLAPNAKYVALGSSYAAGPGIPRQLDACGESDHNYPHLVAAALHLDLVDASCSGAVIANILDQPQGANPPQLQSVTPDASLITFTVGGNDVGYIATAFACGSADKSACTTAVNQARLARQFSKLSTSLTTLVQQLRAKAPKATIVMVTYPRLVPASACPALEYSPAADELVGSLGERLEATFATVAKQTGVRIADPYVLAAGHGPCAGASQRWVDGASAPDAFPYHPTAAGHAEMAHLVEKALQAPRVAR